MAGIKGHLRIDFDMAGNGTKQVTLTGSVRQPSGQTVDPTADFIFCEGILAYARLLLARQELKKMEDVPQEPTVEIAPAGTRFPEAPRRNGH